MHSLWLAVLIVLLINLPFGFWRAGTRRFSRAWFLSVHVPVPLAIGVRFASGIGFRPVTIPLFVATFFVGQLLGGRARRWWGASRSEAR